MIRFFSITLLLFINLFASSEMQRVDSMLQDIKLLRQHYEMIILKEQQKNKLLQKRLNISKQEIKHLKYRRCNTQKIVLIQKICEDENKFPKLKLQKQ